MKLQVVSTVTYEEELYIDSDDSRYIDGNVDTDEGLQIHHSSGEDASNGIYDNNDIRVA